MNTAIWGDLKFAAVAMVTICVYLMLFLGSPSPLHCRLVLAILGILCVLIAIASGYGICFSYGWLVTEIAQVLPPMMLGIGVDDMFVICNSIDQQPYSLPTRERIRRGMYHAGPSITITSLTDATAFFIGANSSFLGVQAFCIFAGVTVIMLYLTQISIFLCFVVWDTKRVACGFHECAYLCFCREDSIVCCKGKLMTPS